MIPKYTEDFMFYWYLKHLQQKNYVLMTDFQL